MKVRASNWALAVSLVFLGCSLALSQGQPQQPSPIDPNAPLQPLPPAGGTNAPKRAPSSTLSPDASPYDPSPYDPSQVAPDQNTLAGAAPFTLGSLQHNRNIFDPSISFSQLAQAYPQTGGGTSLNANSVVNGSLNFDRTWSGYHLSMIYNGGESFNYGYSGGSFTHYQFHDFVFSQEADWDRWHVLFRDDFTVSPGAAFTSQGFGGPGLAAQFSSLLGSSVTGLSQSFVPEETINTTFAERFRNAVLGQAEYSLSRRSAFTAAASYGLLHFDVPGFFNSMMVNVQGGYDYLLDPWNSIAFLGNYGRIDYTGTGASTIDYSGALAYGRKITGRLAFQAAVGPQEIRSQGSVLGTFNLLYVMANSSLRYERRRGGLSVDFLRGLNQGSGVFEGATGDRFSANAHYRFTRLWSGSLTGGYALNESLAPAGSQRQQFTNWFVGANIGRQVGAHAQLNFNYGVNDQTNPPTCATVVCGIAGLQQIAGVTVNWHLRRFAYEQ
jgi:hypothetical protein